MAENSISNRWWENYLVRYLLPSAAGMLIVRYIDANTSQSLLQYGFDVPYYTKDINTSNLLIWFIFGTVYCYISSYPVLVFHATRVIDFKGSHGRIKTIKFSPYLISSFVFIISLFLPLINNYWIECLIVSSYSIYQVYRIASVYKIKGKFILKEKYNKTSIAYAYIYKLSKRRSIIMEEETTGSKNLEGDNSENNEGTSKKVINKNHNKDLIDSYRHLREHGNTAFIFLLELTLAPIFITLLRNQDQYRDVKLAVVLFLWILPAMCTHWLGQHLERRFALFNDAIDG